MISEQRVLTAVGLVALATLIGGTASGPTVTVVNVVPAGNSGESTPNPEPNLAIQSALMDTMVVTAHLPGKGWCLQQMRQGFFVSTNGGSTWGLVCATNPLAPPSDKPGDFTTRFSTTGDGDRLYISSLLTGRKPSLVSVKTPLSGAVTDMFGGTGLPGGLMDQPQLRTPPGSTPTTQVAMTIEDDGYANAGGVACYYGRFLSASAAAVPISFKDQCIALRAMTGERPWATRLAIHSSGITYAAVLEVHTGDDGITRGEVVVHRGNPWAANPAMNVLKEADDAAGGDCDPLDGQVGVRVVRCVILPHNLSMSVDFGYEVRRGSLAIAVDPTNWKNVYVAWGDGTSATSTPTLHVRKSNNGGKTWDTTEVFKAKDATNPALAVDAGGRLGFLYQQFVRSTTTPPDRWHTRLRVTGKIGESPRDILLADTPAVDPAPDFTTPYQGDYTDLVAIGNDFLGAFSARNDPTLVHFPHGVTYNRYCKGGMLRRNKKNNAPTVAPSVDPFFFRVRPGPVGEGHPGTGLSC